MFGTTSAILMFLLPVVVMRDVWAQAINRALRQPTSQSSTYSKGSFWSKKSWPSSLSVDGNTDTSFYEGGSCSHTQQESHPWWAVDLGKITRVMSVKLTNRGDLGSRTSGFIVGLSIVSPNASPSGPVLGGYTICGRGPDITGDGATFEVHCEAGKRIGRYVIIQLPRTTNLNFCELQVFGEDVIRCTTNNGNCSHLCHDAGEQSDDYYCSCRTGFTLETDGRTCTDVDECSAGRHNCSSNAICANEIGHFTCRCVDGFQGNGFICNDIDECYIVSHRCSSNAKCVNEFGSYSCRCLDGFQGDGFECNDVDECSSTGRHNCNSNANCKNAIGNYTCHCLEGFHGDGFNCDDHDECSTGRHQCSQNATCSNAIGSYTCRCDEGFHGNGFKCDVTSTSSVAATVAVFIVITSLLVGLTAVLLLLLIRYRKKLAADETCSISMDGGTDHDSDKVIYEETTYSTSGLTATGVKLSQLEEQIRLLNEADGFKQQFEQLPRDDLTKCTVGKQPDNKKKNRFVNILPYDASRVSLHTKGNATAGGGYINASYITKYNDTGVQYIATQAPKPETLNDFWLMIWHENVECIASLVLLFEGGKARCHKYWPDIVGDSSEFGKITVKLDELETFAEYTRRTMSVRIQGAPPKKVVQLQYLVWPDKSTPNDLWSLLAFRRRVRLTLKSVSSIGGPLVVHCSAGVGRTGTFIALDMLLEEVNKTGKVDVFSVVKHLRLQRMSSVQGKDQYILLYNSILDSYKTGETSISKSGAHELDTNSLHQKMETEFKLLDQLKPRVPLSYDLEALQPLNASKNRRQDVVPSNKSRAILPPRTDESDYINAVIATGYKTPAFYLLTQLPLAHTVDDFWQMIVAENITSIVMLDPVTPYDNVSTVEFWPRMAGKMTNYGPVNVTLQSTRPYDPDSGIVIHSLQVAGKQASKPSELVVRIHELTSWTKDQDTPNNIDDFLELIHLIGDRQFLQMQQQRQRKRSTSSSLNDVSKLSHVAVMCLDGATRSGLYAATSLTIDRLKCDEEIDVLPSCRYITAARPLANTSLKQYEFVYCAAMRFLSWTPRQLTSADSQWSAAVYGNGDAAYGNVDRGAGGDLDIYANTLLTGRTDGQSSSDNDDQRLYANFEK